jgi:NAD(P)-dependent dehydrogenase (short-subunit alcohol dehydrogenase family)
MRIAVVSGGGTGIGAAIAASLAGDGTTVVIVGRRAAVLDATAAALNASLGEDRVRPVVADLTEPDAVAAAAQAIASIGQPIDVLVNNAGGNYEPAPATELNAIREQYLNNFAANVLPVVLLTQALLPQLRRPGGRIITIGSIAAFRGNASYGAAKAALHPWSTELAGKLAPEGVTVNVIAPGYVGGTPFYRERMTPQFHAERSRQAPLGRGGEASDVAGLTRYLASPEAGYITGQIIQINGGALAGRG